MTLAQLFAQLLRSVVKPTLREVGFTQAGQTFFRRLPEVTHVINFQKNRHNTATDLTFTVNLGAKSCRLGTLLGPEDCSTKRQPDIWSCHWQTRLGHLLPRIQADYWWEFIDEERGAEELANITDALMAYGVPALNALSSDKNLRDLWLSGERGHLTEILRLRYVHYLVQQLGPVERVREIERQLLADKGVTRHSTEAYLELVGVLPRSQER